MKKTQLYTAIILSFCSAQVDFMLTEKYTAIFPRDRVIHIIISFVVYMAIMYLLSFINTNIKAVKLFMMLLIVSRAVYLCSEYISYFHTFHGSAVVGVLLFSVATAVLFWKYLYDKTHLLYSFFIVFNITAFLLIVVLSADKINAANIYSNSQKFDFSLNKLPFLFDIITITAITGAGTDRIYTAKRYITITVLYMSFVTLLQGLCLKGNMMYSVSPLQSMIQTASTATITRFDYIFTIYHTLNYFGAVMLYIWAVRQLAERR